MRSRVAGLTIFRFERSSTLAYGRPRTIALMRCVVIPGSLRKSSVDAVLMLTVAFLSPFVGAVVAGGAGDDAGGGLVMVCAGTPDGGFCAMAAAASAKAAIKAREARI